MRITHVTNTLRADGTGITNIVVDLAAAQASAGQDVTVLCRISDPATANLLQEHGVRLVEGIDTTGAVSTWTSSRAARQLLRDAEIVHVHTVRATLLALIARPLHFLRRSVSTLHNPYQRTVPVMYLAKRVVSISEVDAHHVSARSHGLRRPVVIRNGLIGSPRVPSAASVPAAPLTGRPIVYCGALYERKGVDVLLRAMTLVGRRSADARLHLIGNRDNPGLEALAHELGLDDVVRFEGFHPDPRTFMKAAAVFVLPSRAEGFGNVLTEARSVGAAIIASDVGGIPEALDGGRAGLLVPPEDPEALADAILRVLDDPVLAEDLAARATADLEPFTLEHVAQRYLAVYRGIVGGPASAGTVDR